MLLSLLLACSSPSVTVQTGPTDGLPPLNGVQEYATGKLKEQVDKCYADALSTQSDLSGTVTATVSGSHGILKVEVGGGPEALVDCVRSQLTDSRTQRALGDGDNMVGSVFTVGFTP